MRLEPLLTQRGVALHLDISERTVDRLVASGAPTASAGTAASGSMTCTYTSSATGATVKPKRPLTE
jgi:hypothetical protein